MSICLGNSQKISSFAHQVVTKHELATFIVLIDHFDYGNQPVTSVNKRVPSAHSRLCTQWRKGEHNRVN